MNKDQLKEEKEMEIDLLSLFFYLIQKWKILLLGAIIGGILAEGMTLLKTPMYQSTSTLYMLSKTTSITSMADLQLGSELSSDFTIIASSKPVVDAAVESLKEDKNITLTRGQIQNMLSVANKEDTRMLSITVTSDDPELSYEVADAVTTAAVAQMAAITQTDPPTIVEHPEVASDAMDNGMRKNLAVGILAGLVLVAAIYVILYMMNDRIQTEEDIQTYLDATVLGVIPVDKELAYYSKQEEKTEKEEASANAKEEKSEPVSVKEKELLAKVEDETIRYVEQFVKDTLKAMDMDVEITSSIDKDGALYVDMKGENMGILIGKRGQTLDSLQYLANRVANKHQSGYVRVKLDTENYRARREETLKHLAKNIAHKVKRNRRPVILEPMNPYERRIIHSTLQSDPYVTTHSEGEEPYRKVVVTLKR